MLRASCALCLLFVAVCRGASSQATLQSIFLSSATDIDLANNSVRLPLYPGKLANGTIVHFIVTEASTQEAAAALGVNYAPLLETLKNSSVVQKALSAGKLPNRGGTSTQPLQLQATVNLQHGKRTVVPDPVAGFPPLSFSYSAEGLPGYSPLVQLPDGIILNAPQVAVQLPNGSTVTHPKVLSVAPDKSSLIFAITPGFSQGQAIVYISTEASDPLAATLENVPYVPSLATLPAAALIDLVAFTNGQAGVDSPQRQGLGSAILNGVSPLNIAANTPASPNYSPLWAINLAKWVGQSGDRQTSVAAVQALSAAGQVASFIPMAPKSNPPLGPSGIVVNCPIIATVMDPTSASAAAAGGGCMPSNMGYSCVVVAEPRVKIHYSVGGSTAPANGCTRSAAAYAGTAMSTASPADGSLGQEMVHFAVEASSAGYVAMSFAETEGKMFPADAVIGGLIDPNTGSPVVRTYHISHYGISPSDETNGWARDVGYQDVSGNNKVLCFSRALVAPQAAVVKTINPAAALPINWALGPDNTLIQHAESGSLSLGLTTGVSMTVGDIGGGDATAVRIAHGALMLTAFIVLIPAAVLMARHKWMCGDNKTGTISPTWFKVHQGLNITAVLLALAAVILIFVRFQWVGRADTVSYYTGHRGLGMATVAAMLLQVLLGVVRPGLGSTQRPLWRLAHQSLGWIMLLAGTAASYLGISLIHDLSGIPLAYWLGPALSVSAALLVEAVLLEYRKYKLEKSGGYDKHVHKVAGPSNGPASLRTPSKGTMTTAV